MEKYEGVNEQMVKKFAPKPGKRELLPHLSAKAQVAVMCRMLSKEGWNDHIAGHISVRQPDGTILINPWELAWNELTAGDIVTVDEEGNNLDSDWNVSPAIGLHLQLHRLRPDVHVVVHNHAHWSGIWANMHRVPPVYDQSGAYVAGDLPLFNEYSGTFEDEDKTLAAISALGDAKWALLANHGSLVVAKDLRQAHLRIVTLEWRSKRAYEVELLGGGVPMSEAAIAQVGVADPNGFPFLFEAMARSELRADPSILNE